MVIEIFIILVINGFLLDFSFIFCKRQFFIFSGFIIFLFILNVSSEYGIQEIFSVKNFEREEGEEGVGRIVMGCQNYVEVQFWLFGFSRFRMGLESSYTSSLGVFLIVDVVIFDEFYKLF